MIIQITQFNNHFGKVDVTTKRHSIEKFDCVSAVYLGANIKESNKKRIKAIVRRKNKERRVDKRFPIIIYETYMGQTSYTLKEKEIII